MLIGMTGLKRSGKDTVANYLVKKYGYTRKAYGDKLKEVVHIMFNMHNVTDDNKEDNHSCVTNPNKIRQGFEMLGCSEEQINDLETKFYKVFEPWWVSSINGWQQGYNISPRKAYQFLGTEVLRDYDPDVWVRNIGSVRGKVVVSDVRFENEAEYIFSNGGVVVEVVNPRLVAEDGHISENVEINATYRVMNDSTFEYLYTQIDNLIVNMV